MSNKLRQVLVLEDDGFNEITFLELKKGDLFKLNEPDGSPVEYQGNVVFEALGDPYLNKNGTPEIEMTKYDPRILH